MQNKPAFIHFVRNTLGCTCPNEIFEQIEYTPDATVKRITVGQRLLIYIWELDKQETLTTELPILVAKGKAERDQRGLNRFRLVIVSETPEKIAPLATQAFTHLAPDEKIHLHVVSQATVNFATDNTFS